MGTSTLTSMRPCAVCGVAAGSDLHVVRLWWRRAGVTRCEMCSGCWRTLLLRRGVAALMFFFGCLLTFGAGIAAVIFISQIFAGRERDRAWFTRWGSLCAIVTIVSLAAALLAAKVRVPAPLRAGRKARHLVRFQRLGDAATITSVAPETDDVPANFEAAVIRSIEAGDSIYTLAGICGTLPDAIKTFADYMELKYAPQQATPNCIVCNAGNEDELKLTEWTWQSPASGDRTSTPTISALMLLSGHIHIGSHKQIRCQTYHAFCRACVRRSRNARYLASALTLPIGLFLVVAFIAMFGGITVGMMQKNRDDRFTGWLVAMGGAGAIALAIWLFKMIGRRRIPEPLRPICRTPFSFKSMRVTGPLYEEAATS